MASDATFQPPRKKINILWWLAGLFVVLLLLFMFQLFGPGSRIIVSPQTTYITQPLGPDGLPDYEKYLLELYREGVTPQNNAATLLWQAMWPGELSPPDYAAVAAELGLKQIPSTKDSLVPVSGQANRDRVAAWLSRRIAKPRRSEGSFEDELSLHTANEEAADRVLDQAMSRPWTSEQIPPLAKWVAENKKPLDLIVEASRRPRCYFPSPSLLNNESEPLISMLLPGAQGARETGRSLSARSMWHLGEGRVEKAWQDILAAHRIARLTAQGHTLIEQLVAIAIDGLACDRAVTLLHHGNLSAEQAKSIARELIALKDHSRIADSFDLTERAMYLDIVTRIGTGRGNDILSEIGMSPTLFTVLAVDWNIVLRTGNEYYDRFAAASRLSSRAARLRAISQIYRDLKQLEKDLRTPATVVAATFSQSGRGEAVAAVMVNLLLPTLDAAMTAQDRANTKLELTRLAAALAVFQAEHGAYPETLDDLAPGVLEMLPVDVNNAKPFIYHRDGEGYLLYSSGENGVDDGGSNERQRTFEGRELDELKEAQSAQTKIPAGADDVSIRLPRPALKLPKIPLSADEP